ncbi:hypothetical protein EXIGLDRAFT_429102 [Exidia glandulosa HHB12029]|uniref:Uncharacterized protein n=1 Tax=Exidia glandulosa HHB12029 TaxID=1314781 RepID=A0A165KJP0_EXIGL|nr:hypothetical protein EXIGLDRAFT_429102 [Exidia glandulosa HHB12029]
MFTLDDALEDEYGIHQNAYLLCRSYARSKRVMEDSIEAHLRSPIDDVLQVVFEEEGRLHYEEEVAMVLPRRSESMRKALGLATQSTAHMDTAIAGLAYYNVADEQEWEVFNHPELHAFHIRTQACDDGSDDNPPHRIALLDLGWEYTMVEAPTVRNQTVLNTAISLLHRQYVDMKSRPLWGFAVCYRTVKFYTTEWEGDIPIIREWTDELTLHTFKDWVRLYIMLVHIRKKIQGYPPPNININAALRRPAWRYPEANTKRGPSTDLSSENPPKKPKLFPGPGSASGSPMGGGGGRGGMADDESPRDSDVSMPTTPETEQIHAPVPVRLADQHSMRSFRLDAETLGKEHAVQDGMDVVYV